MVLVVISVMGGWLRMFRTSFHGLSGDVVIQSESLSGFPHYQDVINEVEKLPEVSAAVPVIQTFGLININNRKTTGVQVFGYPIDRIGKVNEFPTSLYRQYQQWQDWAEGGAILPVDRQRLHDVLGIKEIRDGRSLLVMTQAERDRLQKAQPEVTKKLGELTAAVAAAGGNDAKRT